MLQRSAAHRKKVQERAEKVAQKSCKYHINRIRNDQSEGKVNSHKILQGHISSNGTYLNVYTKTELHMFLDAYRVKFKKTANKSVLCNVLKDAIMADNCFSIPHPEAFVQQTQQVNDNSTASSRQNVESV